MRNSKRKLLLLITSFITVYAVGQEVKNTENKVTDGDGNTYSTVIIGNQEWMTENLKTTKYNDSTLITNLTEVKEWVATKEGAYCWYNNDKADAISKNYGALYNWYAVKTEKLCPAGWHVPSYDEWITLAKYVSEEKAALKSKSGWKQDNINVGNGTDLYGFSATPAGTRSNKYGVFSKAGSMVQYWTTKEYLHPDQALFFHINNNAKPFAVNSNTKFKSYKYDGLSVRCVRNVSNNTQDKSTTIKYNQFLKIKVADKGAYINVENGLACGNIAPGWLSAQWVFEPVEGTPYVRIKNRWKGTYLNIEHGQIESSEIAPGWLSAQWLIEPIAGTKQFRIKNRWKEIYLYQNTLTDKLLCSENKPASNSALWEIEEM